MTSTLPTTATTDRRPAGPGAGRPHERGALALLAHQIRYEQLSFWRNPQSMVFTFVLPVVIIAIFGAVFGGGQGEDFFFGMSGMEYYTPTIAAVS
ncbi:ABC transporter permease, partial [Streptomyces althioticus]